MINILVLGHKGMLGHMICKVMGKNPKYKVVTTDERFPNWSTDIFNNVDFVINGIGAIPQRTDDFSINSELPIWLDQNFKGKIIHPGTDCEMDGDGYGVSKKIAADWIIKSGDNTKIIKTSIIGPELYSRVSLLEWFLYQTGKVDGYTKAIWNGVTTLEWAKQCEVIINNWESSPILTILCGDKNSKYELLKILQECYQKNDVKIIPKELGKDKTLKGDIRIKNIREQILELIRFDKKSMKTPA